MPDSIRAFSEPIPGVDWDSMQPDLIHAMERVFERNGWSEEPDRFTLDVARKVAAFPPWDIPGRINAFAQSVAERYELSPEKAIRFQASLVRESAGLMLRQGPAMLAQGREALQARANGVPYTADQIARWSKDAEPLFLELAQRVDRLSNELDAALDGEKKELFQKDRARYNLRQEVVDRMTARWAKGQWYPEEWGLDDDPIQMHRASSAANSSGPASAAKPVAPPLREVVIPSRWIDHDPATWIALLLEVRNRYKLDSGQMSTAWSIHGELVERAAAYAEGRSEELTKVPAGERSTHDAYQPIRGLFAELRERLEALPTSSQKEGSGR